MQGKVVVILRTSSVARAPVYKHLREKGIIFVLIHPVQPEAAFDGVFHYHLIHDTHDVDALEPVLGHFLTLHGLSPDAVVSFDEYAVYPAAVLAQRLGFRPIPLPPEKLQRTCIKSLLREDCAGEGIASLVAGVLTRPPPGEADLLAHVQRVLGVTGIKFPLVLKPSPGAGSLLAKLCFSVEEVRDHALVMWDVLASHSARRHFEAVCGPTVGKEGVEILFEEYISGQEVDLNCCIENGKVVFCSIDDNFEVRPPYFVETGGLCPTALQPHEQNELRKLLDRYVAFHGKDLHGVLHFEAKYDFERRQAYIIEVNCRHGSAETDTMIRTCYRGLQLGESLVRCALGLSVTEQLLSHYPERLMEVSGGDGYFPASCYCASVNIYPCAEGVLVRAEAPTSEKALVEYSVSAVPGELVAPPPKSFCLLAWMVAQGATAEEAKSAITHLTENFVQEISVAH
ncbi:biotin carboxylase [Trypanosoma rangeli]|uniref:Biotin carboxylase n=1 Tax=Trypanosoma rangeli TaxID=5698 RepID=A0A3R7KHD1_TRYRA|nr:biotin carboxylase [Trypanosoma rangeli]RNF06518.1 biotin carboxylase [Trypanosoma rangeli]|eukprot:RNF06518.1 biotin carboxylase [Trypanosoma rangeli]